MLANIQQEAAEKRAEAKRAESMSGLQYRAQMTSIGPFAQSFLRDDQMARLLTSLFGSRFDLTDKRSCLTIYSERDHLGPQLDKPAEECAVTILFTSRQRNRLCQLPETGLVLRVFGPEMKDPPQVRLEIPTRTGGLVLGRGSKVWHERPRLQAGEQVVAITGCYCESATE